MGIDRDAVLKVFLAEATEELATIEQGLVRLEDQPADLENLQEIFRMAHSLK